MAALIPEEAVAITIANSPPTNKIDPAQIKQTHSKRLEEISFVFFSLISRVQRHARRKGGGLPKREPERKSLLAIEGWHATDWLTWRRTQSVGGGSASSNLQLYIKQSPYQT